MQPSVCFDLTPFASKSRFRGIGTFSLQLARALQSSEVLRTCPFRLQFLVGRGSDIRVVDDIPSLQVLCKGNAQYSTTYQASKKIFGRWALARSKVDLFHATDPKGTPHVGVGKTVVTCLDIIPTILGGPYLRFEPRWFNIWINRMRYRLPDHVVAISHSTKHDICKVLRIPEERVTVVHLGVRHDQYNLDKQPGETERVVEALGTDGPFFLYVGAFDSRKQVPTLMCAFSRVAGQVDEDLVITGRPDPSMKKKLLSLRKQLGLEKRIHFPGYVPDELLPAAYRAATAHAFPSTYEGFGLTLLEAMASGCPVIACRVSSMPEVCGDAALWVKPGDVTTLSESLVTIAHDASTRHDLRRLGRSKALEFTWERAAEETLQMYRKML